MAENSKIEWTHHTFNCWRGCNKVSPGCRFCYAETLAGRNPKVLGVWGPQGTRVVAAEAQWRQPLKWDRDAKAAGERRRVFCASLADVFEDWTGRMHDAQGRTLWWDNDDRTICATTQEHDGVYRNTATMDDFRSRLFRLIDATPNLDWLLLTKRPRNIASMMPCRTDPDNWPRKNVWLGVSVEDRAHGLPRLDHLRRTPAAVRFVSAEPLLEDLGAVDLAGIDWVIVGGESGGGARPCAIEDVRSVVAQCRAAGVPCFVKQMGANFRQRDGRPYGTTDEDGDPRCWRCGHFDFGPCANGTLLCNGCNAPWDRLRDKKGGDPAEWPADLRVREFPTPLTAGA